MHVFVCACVCACALRMICLEKLCPAIFSNVSYIFQGVFFKFLRHKQFFSSELIVRDFLVTLVNAFSMISSERYSLFRLAVSKRRF